MPKVQTFDYVVPGTPAEVAARLKAVTRYRMILYRPSIFGQGGLAGKIDERSFAIADDQRRFFQYTQAVATGTLEPEGAGSTRIRGQASLPAWITWQLRITYVALAVVSAVLLSVLAGSAGLQGWQLLLGGSLYAVFALVFGAAGIGMHVANADAGVDPLVERLRATTSAGATPERPAAQRVAERE